MVPQSLRPGLADVELSANRTHRGNMVRRELPGEQLRRPLLQEEAVDNGIGDGEYRAVHESDANPAPEWNWADSTNQNGDPLNLQLVSAAKLLVSVTTRERARTAR